MLQHNVSPRHVHFTHAAFVGLHAICCGAPALAVTLVAVSGAATSFVALSSFVGRLHAFLHGHELWLIGVSAVFVAAGVALEMLLRRNSVQPRFPWLLALSIGCFVANATILTLHRAL